MSSTIKASGGIVIRPGKKGVRVAVVHRPAYDDWTLPKGKGGRGETSQETALREVEEETGLRCRVVAAAGTTEYSVAAGDKVVDWFVMRPLPNGLGFKPNSETDEVRWVTVAEAKRLLSYAHDSNLLDGDQLESLVRSGVIFLIRHGAAGDRSKWSGDDRQRPLNKKGRRQAEEIASRLAIRGLDRIVSSPYLRCVETAEPLARLTGLEIEEMETLGEGPSRTALADFADGLVGVNIAVSSHGDVIPALLHILMERGLRFESPLDCQKGSVWTVEVVDGRFLQAVYTPPPS